MKVAIYTRVSTIEQAQEGYSMEAQRHALIKWCEFQGYEYCVYEENGVSGKDVEHRPVLRQLLLDADAGQFDVVLVWAISRLTRKVSDLYTLFERLSAHDVGLLSHTESFDTTTVMGRTMMGMLGVFAQMEREFTSERVIVAMEERARQGKRTCSDVLGYDLEGADSLAIDDDEAQCVRFIYEQYLETHNLSTVAERCKERGYRGKRGGTLKAQHIKIILTRPVYVGYNSFKGRVYKGFYTPIIDAQTFDAVQTSLRRPTLEQRIRLTQEGQNDQRNRT